MPLFSLAVSEFGMAATILENSFDRLELGMVNNRSAHEALGPLLCCNPVRSKSEHRQM